MNPNDLKHIDMKCGYSNFQTVPEEYKFILVNGPTTIGYFTIGQIYKFLNSNKKCKKFKLAKKISREIML